MFRYVAATAALRFLSAAPAGGRAYRLLSRTVGGNRRAKRGLSGMYVETAREFLAIVRRLDLVHEGDHLLELGTGWMHWEATVLRLFYDVSITLFDITDNRQLGAYRQCFVQLSPLLESGFGADATAIERARARIDVIARATCFEELYDAFHFTYVTNPAGSLRQFSNAAFDTVFSVNTLEHVDREILRDFVNDLYRVCKPGGHSVQAIDLGDHVGYYDPSVSPKHYLRYSERTWRTFFENQLQYINRVQRPEWLGLFRDAGFDLLEETVETVRIDDQQVAADYCGISLEDLACAGLTGVWRRPS